MRSLDRLHMLFVAGGALLVSRSSASADKAPPFLAAASATTTTTRLAPMVIAESCPLLCPSDSRCVRMDDIGIELDNGLGYSIDASTGQVYYHGDMLHQDGWVCQQNCPAGTTGAGCSRRVQSCGGDLLCLHGGECIESHFTDSPEQFVCDCTGAIDFREATGNSDSPPTMETDRYVGRFCENVVAAENYCARDAELFCINQGTCRNDAGDFHITPCTCPESHTGKHCEFNVSVEQPLICNLDCGEHGTCRNGRKKDANQGPDAFIDYSHAESKNYMYCECNEGHTGATCEYDFISCSGGQFEHYCFHGSECELIGDISVCSCEKANGRVAGDACQYIASAECERVTGGFCVNGGICEQELSSGTTYCKCGDEFGGNQCETLKETVEDKNNDEPVSKSNPDHDLAASLLHDQQKAPTPAPTAADTIQDTEMDQSPIDGSEIDPADDPAKFFNLDFPITSSNDKNKGETPKTESAAHHNGNKNSSSSSKNTDTASHKEEGMSEPAQFGVFILLIGFLSVFAVAIYRRHRMQKFGKEKSRNIHNANLHYVGDSSSAAGADGANAYRDEIYRNAIFDADGKVEAVEIL